MQATESAIAPEQEGLRNAATRFLAGGALERSVPLRKLFDFLLDSTLAGRMPREIDVAQDVFGRTSGFEMGQDATIRVHVHRLRRKLEEFRFANPAEPTFLTIPRGEYRLMLAAAEMPLEAEPPEIVLPPEPIAAKRPRRRIWPWALAVLAVANLLGWAIFARHTQPPAVRALEATPFWSTLAASQYPTVVVIGDYYIVGEAAKSSEVTRLVREFSINSRDDLDEYLMFHPDQIGRLVDLDLHYLPVSAAPALRSVGPMIDALASHGRVRVITMSQLTPEIVKSSNIVYIGYLSGLALLRNTVFQASSLAVGASYDELIDKRTGRTFVSDWSAVAHGRTSQRDFGYLANIATPGDKQLIVIAGTRDAALMQAGESATDPDLLRSIAARTKDARSAEALVEVSAMGNAALAGKIVLARPLPATPKAVPPAGPPIVYPDELKVSQPLG